MVIDPIATEKEINDADALYEVARLVSYHGAYEVLHLEFHEETPRLKFLVSRYKTEDIDIYSYKFNFHNMIETHVFTQEEDARRFLANCVLSINLDATA
jgi:hypothetical protein